jgi:hypothetical protein
VGWGYGVVVILGVVVFVEVSEWVVFRDVRVRVVRVCEELFIGGLVAALVVCVRGRVCDVGCFEYGVG